MRDYCVYIMTNRSGMFYTGVTNNLPIRVYQHKNGMGGFTSRYRMTRLVYYESTQNVLSAIAREKQIKGWRRDKKIALIRSMNPRFLDLSSDIW